MTVNTTTTANIQVQTDLAPEEQFVYDERYGSRRQFQVQRVSAHGDPREGLGNSVKPFGLNIKKDGTLGVQRINYGYVGFADLPVTVQARLKEAYATACADLKREIV